MIPVIEREMEAVVARMVTLKATRFPALSALIPDDAPYLMYGHIAEINNRLIVKGRDTVNHAKKFPLVVLRLDNSTEVDGDMHRFTLNMAIINHTKQDFNAAQRLSSVFEPILFPLYELFFEAIKRNGFTWSGDKTYPPHTKTDRYFWGTQSGAINIKNVFSDPVDAIEISNLKINKRIKTC